MRTRLLTISLVLLVLLAASCSKEDFSVSNVQAQAYVRHEDGSMGLSLYAMTEAKDPGSMQFLVKAPSGDLSWSFNVSNVKLDGVDYYGSADISVPRGVSLPTGTWSLCVLYKDGSTAEVDFDVSYTDVEGAMERYGANGYEKAWFDSESNLTVI